MESITLKLKGITESKSPLKLIQKLQIKQSKVFINTLPLNFKYINKEGFLESPKNSVML